jgi:Pyridoxamine 5'-phosphate oxidase
MVSWGDFQESAPALARVGRERLERSGVALLGTVRKDGSPRISPVEPVFCGANLLLGLMPWSLKARDLARDPRCVLHSAVTSPDAGEAELKLYGCASEVDDAARREPADAWWVSRRREDAWVVGLEIGQAVVIEWDLSRGEMTVARWSPRTGTSRLTREYP